MDYDKLRKKKKKIQNVYAVCVWYLYVDMVMWKRRTPFSNWKGKYVKGLDVMIPICIIHIYGGNFCLWNTDEYYSCSYYTYLGIHILFGKVMSRILWAVVLLSSKLSLTEIYMAVWLINEIFNVKMCYEL